ncbi:MAG: D-alanyl-D-alanine endopeptidase (penicillin-binding protein 7) [Parcubacteria group bacterium Gr01-1014_66]|nr:MAG: D-alanyl-D-alanine endopeptidase (penicillin-binding protein 7) [Parcubacteria group bacterium Gr01-1014_66]
MKIWRIGLINNIWGVLTALLFLIICGEAIILTRQLSLYLSLDKIARIEQAAPILAKPRLSYRRIADDAVVFSQHDEVDRTKEKMIREKENFIFADLERMKLSVFQEGILMKEVSVQGKGKEGTFFETPNGLYKVRSKEENHFSTIGHVWMPWSIHFYGNYFIHGWPSYRDGTPVAETFSGGCIRISSRDAKEVFRFARRGMPVLIQSGSILSENAHATSTYFQRVDRTRMQERSPLLSGGAALAVDFDTGEILFAKNKTTPYPIASITKLMTGLVAIETINRFRHLTVSGKDSTFPDAPTSLEGETFQSQDFLYPLLLGSRNDVAELYRRTAGGFVETMNQKARGIGMTNTYFADASGASVENVADAEDLFRLLQYIARYKQPVFAVSGVSKKTIRSLSSKKSYIWENTTWPFDDGIFLGGHAGLTSTGKETIAGVLRVRFGEQDERKIAIIVLDSFDRIDDVRALIAYLEEEFVYGTVFTQKGIFPTEIRTGASLFHALPKWR